MKAANLLIRFCLELCALAALAYSGYRSVEPEAGRIALAVAAPLALAVRATGGTQRYDSTDGGGRAASGTAAESNAGARL